MATMDDIAKALGISKGTVSKAFSGAPDVSEEMREKVRETAEKLGYSKSGRRGARKAAKPQAPKAEKPKEVEPKKPQEAKVEEPKDVEAEKIDVPEVSPEPEEKVSDTPAPEKQLLDAPVSGKAVCVFIRDMPMAKAGDSGYDFVDGLRKMAKPSGYSVGVVSLDESFESEMTFDEYMQSNGYLGALFIGISSEDPWLSQLRDSRTPAVLCDSKVTGNPEASSIGIDINEAMKLAVSYLKELGHEKIGFLSSSQSPEIMVSRQAAFINAVQAEGLECDQTFTGCTTHTTIECIETYFPKLLNDRDVTAIICSHDSLAAALMMHCKETGIDVPGELSIIGFGDLRFTEFMDPPLTTIRQNFTELGRSAFFALNSLINKISVSTLLLHAELIKRGSCGEH